MIDELDIELVQTDLNNVNCSLTLGLISDIS